MGIRRLQAGSGGLGAQARCDVCGAPAQWRDRVITACCIYGESLCDRCESKRRSWKRDEGSLLADLTDLASWLSQELAHLGGSVSEGVRSGLRGKTLSPPVSRPTRSQS